MQHAEVVGVNRLRHEVEKVFVVVRPGSLNKDLESERGRKILGARRVVRVRRKQHDRLVAFEAELKVRGEVVAVREPGLRRLADRGLCGIVGEASYCVKVGELVAAEELAVGVVSVLEEVIAVKHVSFCIDDVVLVDA